ncbi:MAG: hypothetical protein WCT04_02415 [Planctomycetota bacterium]
MEIPPKVLQALRDKLKDKASGLVGKWHVGKLVDKFFRSRPAKRGELAALAGALPKGVPASKETLHGCRTLFCKWDLKEVKSFQSRGLPWNRMFQLLPTKPLLKRVPKSKLPEFQKQLSELTADKSPGKEWTRKCKEFKQRLEGEVTAIPPKKRISEKGRVAVDRLGVAAEAWEDMRGVIPEAFKDQYDAVSSEMARLKAFMETLNAKMLSPEKLESYEDC